MPRHLPWCERTSLPRRARSSAFGGPTAAPGGPAPPQAPLGASPPPRHARTADRRSPRRPTPHGDQPTSSVHAGRSRAGTAPMPRPSTGGTGAPPQRAPPPGCGAHRSRRRSAGTGARPLRTLRPGSCPRLPPLGPLVGPSVQRAPEIRVRCGRDAVEAPPVPLPVVQRAAKAVAAVPAEMRDLVVERRPFLLERVALRDRLHLRVTPRPRMGGAAHHRVLVALPHLPLDPRRPRLVVVQGHWTASNRDSACLRRSA